MNTNTLCYFLNNGVKGFRISDVKHFLMTSSEWKRQKLSELQLKHRLISITCENHQISQHTLYIIYTYVIHFIFFAIEDTVKHHFKIQY